MGLFKRKKRSYPSVSDALSSCLSSPLLQEIECDGWRVKGNNTHCVLTCTAMYELGELEIIADYWGTLQKNHPGYSVTVQVAGIRRMETLSQALAPGWRTYAADYEQVHKSFDTVAEIRAWEQEMGNTLMIEHAYIVFDASK